MMHGWKNIKLHNAEQAKLVHQYKDTKIKLYNNNAAIWYNKTCRARQITPTCANISSPLSTGVVYSRLGERGYQMLCLCICSSWGWARQGPKHVEDSDVTYMLLLNCALKLVEEIILYYDAWSKKHQNPSQGLLSYQRITRNWLNWSSNSILNNHAACVYICNHS